MTSEFQYLTLRISEKRHISKAFYNLCFATFAVFYYICLLLCHSGFNRGWSGVAMVLGKLPAPGRPTNLNNSRARAYCACSMCGWGLFGLFSLSCRFSLLSPSRWKSARYRLKYCLKGPLSPKQPTNQSGFNWYFSPIFQWCCFTP